MRRVEVARLVATLFAVLALIGCAAPATDTPDTGAEVSPAVGVSPEVEVSPDIEASPAASPEAEASPEASPLAEVTTCDQAFAAAANLPDVQGTADVLDATLETCDSIDAWMQAAQAYPDILGEGVDPQTFLIERCLDGNNAVGSLCTEVKEQFPEQFP